MVLVAQPLDPHIAPEGIAIVAAIPIAPGYRAILGDCFFTTTGADAPGAQHR